MSYAAALGLLAPRLREALERLGATQPGTLRRLGSGDEPLSEVLEDLGKVVGVSQWNDDELEQFKNLVAAADLPADRRHRQLANLDAMHMAHTAELRKKRARKESFEDSFRGLAVFRGAPVPQPGKTAPSTLTPTTSTAHSGAIDCDSLRDRCVQELREVLMTIKAPIMQQLDDCGPQDISFLAAGRRARTLRTRLRGWKGFATWLRIAYGESWPSSWGRVAEFLEIRAAEPCSRAVVRHVYSGIRFIEEAGGFEGDAAVTNHRMLRRFIKEIEARLGARAGGGEARQAARPLMSQVEALESLVVNERLAPWIRAYGWWMALKCWGVLRYDDHVGLNPSAMKLDDSALRFTLDKTKTTGKDKRVQKRFVAVHREAYLLEPRWLQVGVELRRQLAPQERSYLLETPSPSLEACSHRQLRYHEAAAWSRSVLVVSGAVGEGDLSKLAASFYTEHSGRSFLPSAGLMAGFTDADMGPLGGWGATNTRSYIRTAAEKVLGIQRKTAVELRRARAHGKDMLGDEQEARKLLDYLVERGVDADQAAAHVAKMLTGSRRIDPAAVEPRTPIMDGDAAEDTVAPEPVTGPDDGDVEAYSDRVPPEARGYCISITAKTNRRRLHYVGRCYRVPGVDYSQFEWWGQELPGPATYDAVCRQCWKTSTPGGMAGSSTDRVATTRAQEPGHSEDEEGTTDESSSSVDA